VRALARRTSSDDAVVVRETAAIQRLKREVESNWNHFTKRNAPKIAEMGRRLKLLKATIEHGNRASGGVNPVGWGRSLKKNFDMSATTADNIMRFHTLSTTGNYKRLLNIGTPFDLMYRLQRLGEEAQDRYIENIKGGAKPRRAMSSITVRRGKPSPLVNIDPGILPPGSHNVWDKPVVLPPGSHNVWDKPVVLPPGSHNEFSPHPPAKPPDRFNPHKPPPPAIPDPPVTIHPSSIPIRAAALAEHLQEITRYAADGDAAAVATIVSWDTLETIERLVQAVKKAKAEVEPIERDAS
jgi:hypothetical protein